ncbi:MAG TPA: hypothetical protein VGE21_09805 [Flavobacteriales bacterium]
MEQLQADLQLVRIYRSLIRCRYEDALRQLDELLCDRPDHGVAHGILADLCNWLLDDPRRARVHFRFAVRFAPEVEMHYHKFAKVLVTLGDAAGLEELIQLAQGRSGIDRTPLIIACAEVKERMGLWSDALVHYRSAATLATDDDTEEACGKSVERMLRRLDAARWGRISQA